MKVLTFFKKREKNLKNFVQRKVKVAKNVNKIFWKSADSFKKNLWITLPGAIGPYSFRGFLRWSEGF